MGGSARCPEGKTGEWVSFHRVRATELGLDEQTRLSRVGNKAGGTAPSHPSLEEHPVPTPGRAPGARGLCLLDLGSELLSHLGRKELVGLGMPSVRGPLSGKEPALDLLPLKLDH